MHDRAGAAPLRLGGREAEVVRLAAQGLTDKEIAERLGISLGTVGTYWKRALERLDAHSRTQAVALLAEQEIQILRGELSRMRSGDASPRNDGMPFLRKEA